MRRTRALISDFNCALAVSFPITAVGVRMLGVWQTPNAVVYVATRAASAVASPTTNENEVGEAEMRIEKFAANAASSPSFAGKKYDWAMIGSYVLQIAPPTAATLRNRERWPICGSFS